MFFLSEVGVEVICCAHAFVFARGVRARADFAPQLTRAFAFFRRQRVAQACIIHVCGSEIIFLRFSLVGWVWKLSR